MDTTEVDTTWGHSPSTYEVDVRALRRYNQLLMKAARAGEVLMFVLVLGAAGTVAKLLLATNFEHIIIYDGTVRACLYDGETGQIRDVEQRN